METGFYKIIFIILFFANYSMEIYCYALVDPNSRIQHNNCQADAFYTLLRFLHFVDNEHATVDNGTKQRKIGNVLGYLNKRLSTTLVVD